MLNWLLKLTKVGGAIDKVRALLDGKKTYLIGIATAVPALVNLVLEFQRDGAGALTNLADNRNYELLMLGIGMLTGRAAISKAGQGNLGPADKPENQ